MSSSGRTPTFHGANGNPDKDKLRRFLDELDDLFPPEDPSPPPPASNNTNSNKRTAPPAPPNPPNNNHPKA